MDAKDGACTSSSALNLTVRYTLICREGEFEGLPEAVRLRGPWDIQRRGQVLRLRTDYRSRIDRFGYV
jgi:hypothetical protein